MLTVWWNDSATGKPNCKIHR